MFSYILIFLFSCFFLYFSSNLIINSLTRIAKFLNWREFVVAFFIMAFAASLPNLFVGIISAVQMVPQLSFGDVAGNNIAALTIAVALAVLIGRREIPVESRTVQTTSIFTIIAAILPLILILDGSLSRIDGVLLIALFIFYISWLFSKQERFSKIYEEQKISIIREFKIFLKDLGKVFLGVFLLLLSAQGIVTAAQFFAQSFAVSIFLIGVLITGLGNALPEIFFAIASAKRGETWMILGDLMGAVVVPSTLVLGFVSLVHPIKIIDFSPFAVARFFLIISVIFFFFFIKTDRKITKKEAIILLSLYFIFIIVELLMK